MGGAVAIELATQRPNLFVQLILAEANIDAGGGMLSRSIAEQTEIDFIESGFEELLNNRRNAAMNEDYKSSIPLGIWQVASPKALHRSAVSLVKGTQPVMWENLIQLSIPRTFIFGSRSLEEYDEDRVLQRRLEEHNIQIAVVPNAGHGMMVDNLEGFAAIIEDEIARNE
jgi:pimeloyl-ACP methyl ester carboxylesterase